MIPTLWQIRDSAMETVICNLAPDWPVRSLVVLTWPEDEDKEPEGHMVSVPMEALR
jgi:hypothetical protein